MTPVNTTPFEVTTEPGGRAFVAFVTGEGVLAWPWHALKALRLSTAGDALFFDFSAHSVEITGRGLEVIADLAGAARLKALRTGETTGTCVSKIRILGDITVTP